MSEDVVEIEFGRRSNVTRAVLPRRPSRDNWAFACKRLPDSPETARLPDHLVACACETHDAVCIECDYKITLGNDRVEYGHARAQNRDNKGDTRKSCEHRPLACNPQPSLGRQDWSTPETKTTEIRPDGGHL